MKRKDRNFGIPDFSSDEEAFEWYESHDMMEHLDDTEEVNLTKVVYQDKNGNWFSASDGLTISAKRKNLAGLDLNAPSGLGFIVYENVLYYSFSTLSQISDPWQDIWRYFVDTENVRMEDSERLCALTTHSYATTQRLGIKLMPSV